MNKNTTILIAGAMISLAVFFGLRSNQGGPKPEEAPTLGETEQIEPEIRTIEASFDDDAILGDAETAKVGIVEFSDYECPFCKRFVDQTLGQIKENYIETGKVALAFRDLPLPFHDPAASLEAQAAECARDQGGDEIYFEYHDAIFANSPGNGVGLAESKLGELADEMGLDGSKLVTCLEDDKFKSEVEADSGEAARAGINGTPGFVVGKLDDKGMVRGELISGAQPYSVFAQVIEKYLNE